MRTVVLIIVAIIVGALLGFGLATGGDAVVSDAGDTQAISTSGKCYGWHVVCPKWHPPMRAWE